MTSTFASRGAISNSGRKRAPVADLRRPAASPSRSDAIAGIFNDAARCLQAPMTPCSSNTKRSRIPFSQARSARFGDLTAQNDHRMLQGETPLIFETGGQNSGHYRTAQSRISIQRAETPTEISCGMQFPTPLPVINTSPLRPLDTGQEHPRGQVEYPASDASSSSRRTPTFDSDDEECHSTHGVPLVLPLHPTKLLDTNRSNVDEWLDGVRAKSSAQSPELKSPREQGSSPSLGSNDANSAFASITLTPPSLTAKFSLDKRVSSTSSNKENRPPPPYFPSPTRRPMNTRYLSANLSRFGISPPPNLSSPSHQLKRVPPPSPRRPPRTPPGSLTQPPKRHKKASSNGEMAGIDPMPTFPNQEHEPMTPPKLRLEEETMEMVQLSPEVEIGRKGRGRAKTERCASYWDEDIVSKLGNKT